MISGFLKVIVVRVLILQEIQGILFLREPQGRSLRSRFPVSHLPVGSLYLLGKSKLCSHVYSKDQVFLQGHVLENCTECKTQNLTINLDFLSLTLHKNEGKHSGRTTCVFVKTQKHNPVLVTHAHTK